MTSVLKPDAQVMREFLRALGTGPDYVIEMRVLNAKINGFYQPQTFSGFFNDIDALVREACRVENAKGWFITLNPVMPDLLARRCNRIDRAAKGDATSDKDIVRRAWLPIDLDADRPAGISSTDEEHQAALDRAQEVLTDLGSKGWPAPIIADSGNGGHLLYRVNLASDDAGLVKRCLEALNLRFSDAKVKVDTSVFNPARIWKLYGTPVCKGDSTSDRPHRMACILKVPDNPLSVVPTDLLENLAAEAPVEAKPKTPAKAQAQNTSSKPEPKNIQGFFNLDGWILRYLPDAEGPRPYNGGGRIWEIRDCVFRPGDGKTMFIIQHPNGAISAGCQHDTCPGSKNTGNHWLELRQHFEGAAFHHSHSIDPGLDMELSTLPRTEYGLSERFQRRFGDQVRFVENWGGKWLVYEGQLWMQSTCAAELYAQETVAGIDREAKYLKEKTDGSEKP